MDKHLQHNEIIKHSMKSAYESSKAKKSIELLKQKLWTIGQNNRARGQSGLRVVQYTLNMKM